MMPALPSRDNAARDCEILPNHEQDPTLPDHIAECSCEEHSGVCLECNYKITIGPSGTAYGHARRGNKSPNGTGKRTDCPHRPPKVDPIRGNARGGRL